jgi:hypothetical protein
MKEKLSETLERKIENRPTREELVDHNIMKGLISLELTFRHQTRSGITSNKRGFD